MLLALDQATKTLAQLTFAGHTYEPLDGWGLTFVVNPGTWLWPDASRVGLLVAHGLGVLVWAGWVAGTAWYSRHYRRSTALAWAVGFMTVAAFGNAIDRIVAGGARDWAITPIATGNLADVAVWPAILLLAAELVSYPPSRRLLSLDPRRWKPD